MLRVRVFFMAVTIGFGLLWITIVYRTATPLTSLLVSFNQIRWPQYGHRMFNLSLYWPGITSFLHLTQV